MLKPVPQRLNKVTDDSPLPRSWQKQTGINPIELSTVFKNLDPNSSEHRFLLIFWIRMAEIFQQFWTNAQGTVPTDMWAQCPRICGHKRCWRWARKAHKRRLFILSKKARSTRPRCPSSTPPVISTACDKPVMPYPNKHPFLIVRKAKHS